MKRYEYKVITPLFRIERKLNQLGYEGWELVAASGTNLFLRREYDE